MKTTIKKRLALVAALCVILAAALPALAGGGLSDQYSSLEPGKTYDLTGITLSVPLSDYGYSGLATLYGADVSGGRIHIAEDQGPYNFVWEQTLTTDDIQTYGAVPTLLVGYSQVGNDLSKQFPIDGKTLFGFQNTPSEMSVKMTFTDVQLTGQSEDLFMYDEYYAVGPYVPLTGKVMIEITTTIDGTYTIPAVKEITTADPSTQEYVNDIGAVLRETQAKVSAGISGDGITRFDEPQTITAKIELEGTLAGVDGIPEMDVVVLSSRLSEGQHFYWATIGAQGYVSTIYDSTATDGFLDTAAFSIDCPLLADARWSVTPYGELPSNGGVIDNTGGIGGDSYGDVGDDYFDAWLEEMNLSQQNLTNQPAKVALIAAGTGVTALGASIIASLIGDVMASATTSAVSSAVSATASEAASATTTAASGAAPDTVTTAASGPDSTVDEASGTPPDTSATERKRFEETTADEETAETPDLPEEDSPEVSMSLFAPDKDLLNVKGGAASITVQIEGGEGYLWNYIPAIICPGTMKAIIPTVTGRSHLATLNLGMTGTKLESRHYEVFVNLIAWAATPDGKVLKTSGSMEMKLHEPGIEARKNADGSVTVTACVETTLKGFADVRTLSPEEYTCTTLEDGTLEIRAIDPKLGTARIEP